MKFLEIIADRRVSKVIVAYENRLIRFGFETLRRLFSAFNIAIEIINHEEETPQGELCWRSNNYSLAFCWKALWFEEL